MCLAAAFASLPDAVVCRIEGVAGGEWSNGGLGGVGVGRDKARRPSGIVKLRWADRGGGDERNETFGATDAANPLRVAMQ